MSRRRAVLLLLFSVSLFLVAPAWSAEESPNLKKLSFLPHWRPQAQFAGYYMALHKGLYEKHGLSVTILEGGPTRSATAYLKENKAEIASLWLSTALQLAGQGTAVVNVAQIGQRSALVLAAKKSAGINKPEDMNGKKIALWSSDFEIQPKAFFDKYHLQVQTVTTENPVSLFLHDGVQIASVMWYNEYHTLVNSGLDPDEMTLFFFDEYDLNFPEDGIYLRKEVFEKDPEAAWAFAAASLEGWRYAFEHPNEAVDLIVSIMEEAHIPANRMHQAWMLDRMRDLAKIDDAGNLVGTLDIKDYQRVSEILVKDGLIRSVPSYESFFRERVIHETK